MKKGILKKKEKQKISFSLFLGNLLSHLLILQNIPYGVVNKKGVSMLGEVVLIEKVCVNERDKCFMAKRK